MAGEHRSAKTGRSRKGKSRRGRKRKARKAERKDGVTGGERADKGRKKGKLKEGR